MQHTDSIKLIEFYCRLQLGRELEKLRLIAYIPDWLYFLEFIKANRN